MNFETIELFSSLSHSELKEVQQIARRVQFGRGETIFREGDFETNLYVVESGQVEIVKRDPLRVEHVIMVCRNGDFFGEMALFEKNTARSVTARALQATTLIVIGGQDFETLLQTRSAISMKLLAALSRRLRSTTALQVAQGAARSTAPRPSRLVVIAAAKDGYGKTTLATTLAQVLAAELPRKVLFIDLDLCFADGTFSLGIHAARSIIDLASRLRASDHQDPDVFLKSCVKLGERLWVLPGPTTFLDAEKLQGTDLARILKEARALFDYVVIDTSSHLDEVLLNAFDTADHILFLVDTRGIQAIKDNVRFLQGVAKLNFPRERVLALAARVGKDFTPGKTAELFPFPIAGGIPEALGWTADFSKTLYQAQPRGGYVEVVRLLTRTLLREKQLAPAPNEERGLLSRLFASDDSTMVDLPSRLIVDPATLPASEQEIAPIISPHDIKSLVKYVRYNMVYGHMQQARTQLLGFLDYAQPSSQLYELLGEICAFEKDYDDAIGAFNHALALEPDNHLALGYLACMSNDPAMFARARKLLEQRIATHPEFADLVNDDGKILMQHREFPAAQARFEQALKINPRFLEARLNLATTLAAQNHYEEALEMLLALKLKNPRIFMMIGQFCHDTGRFHLAQQAYQKASEVAPDYPGLRQRINELTLYFKKLASVIEMHENVVNTQPQFPDLHARLAGFYALAGKTEVAMAEYRKALELKPSYREAQEKLAALQSDVLGKLARARLEESVEDYNLLSRSLRLQIKLSGKLKDREVGDQILQVKNVRTAKVLQKVLTAEELAQAGTVVDCTPLGVVACQDILLVQLTDARSGQMLRFAPHHVQRREIDRNESRVRLDLVPAPAENEPAAPTEVRYLLVQLASRQIAQIIANKDSGFRALVRNTRNGLEAEGHLNPENDEQVAFVLTGSDGRGAEPEQRNAARPGDRLAIRVIDPTQTEVFTLEATLAPEDIACFCKLVATEAA